MQLDTLVMPEEDAKARLREYEQSLKTDRNAEDEAIAAGYRAAARGLPVIKLSAVMAAGGWFDNGLPRLAIVRADATQCFVRTEGWGDGPRNLVFADESGRTNRSAIVAAHTVRIDNIPKPKPIGSPTRERSSGRTIVPSVPPRFRPGRHRIRGMHVLWEVEEWSPAPPVDPALLRHIRGDLWSVLATWNLTPLERAVLTARARS